MSADKFEEWWDAPKDPLTLQDRYRECWLASRKAALEEAAKVCEDDAKSNALAPIEQYRAMFIADSIRALKEE